MGRYQSNLAYAYDEAQRVQPTRQTEQRTATTPHFDVYTGAGNETSVEVSPVFMHCIKVAVVLVSVMIAICFLRVSLAGYTTSILNTNAQIRTSLDEAVAVSKDLEVMTSVYGSESRIRDIAISTLGMVEPTEHVTLDLSNTSLPAK